MLEERGDLEGAANHLREALKIVEQGDDAAATATVRLALGGTACQKGDFEESLARAERLLASVIPRAIPNEIAAVRALMTEATARVGNVARAFERWRMVREAVPRALE